MRQTVSHRLISALRVGVQTARAQCAAAPARLFMSASRLPIACSTHVHTVARIGAAPCRHMSMSMFEDITIQCKDCGVEFIHSADEQDHFQKLGFEHQPARCLECRRARKQMANRSAYGDGGGMRRFVGNCFNCGEDGHRASECPQGRAGAPAGGAGGAAY